jgi:hypothetical protein
MFLNREVFNEPWPTIGNQLNDFVTRRHDKVLRPLHFADMSRSQFSAELEGYLSLLDSGGSITFSRGEELASIRLSQRGDPIQNPNTPGAGRTTIDVDHDHPRCWPSFRRFLNAPRRRVLG